MSTLFAITKKVKLALLLPITLLSLIFILPSTAKAQLASVGTSPTPFYNSIGNNGIVFGIGYDCADFEESCSYFNVFDFSNKNNPQLLYTTTTPAQAASVIAYQDYAYVTTYQGKFLIYDVTNPSAPILVDTLQMPDSISLGGKLRMIDGYLVTPFFQNGFAGPGGILIFDVESDPANPTILKRIDYTLNESGAGDVAQSGHYLYASDYFGYALRVYDIADISNPILVQTITNINEPNDYKVINGTGLFEPWGLLTKDNALYLLDDNVVQVYNISSSTNMVYDKTIIVQKAVEGFAIKDNILYFGASFDDKLSYYDVTDAFNPTLISEVTTPAANNNYWISVADDGYYYIDSTQNNILSVYEPLKIVKSAQTLNVPKDSLGRYLIRLIKQPSADVTVTLATTTSAGEPCVRVSPSSLTFNSSNWSDKQTVTVQSVSGTGGCPLNSVVRVGTTVSSGDSFYNNAVVSDVVVTTVSGFTSVTNGPWNKGNTWGKTTADIEGIDYPTVNGSSTIAHTVNLVASTSLSYLTITQTGTLNLSSQNLNVTSQFINNGILNGNTTFTSPYSFNNGTINGTVIFNDQASNILGGTVHGTAIFQNAAYNQGTVDGDSVFIGNIIDATGITTGSITRKYTANASTTRNFLTENGHNNWIVIADGAVVDISSSTYATSTNTFKAINGGSFIFGANVGGPVVPSIVINTPTTTSIVTKWAPSVTWGTSATCYYSYDNFVSSTTTYQVTCGNNGTDIGKPSSAGSTTLYVRGVDSHGSLSEKSVTFTYDNTVAVPTSCGTDLLDESSRPYYYLTGNVTGDCRATVTTELRGASTTDVTGFTVTGNMIATSSGAGYNIILKNITFTGFVIASGADGSGSNGGNITIATSTTGAINSKGGDGNTQGGNGGTIQVTNSQEISSSTPITADGGNATVCGHGGSGGSVTLFNSIYGNISINAGSDQTVIGSGLCQAPPTGPSGSTGSQSIINIPFINQPPVINNQVIPADGDVAVNSSPVSSGGSTIILSNTASTTQTISSTTITSTSAKSDSIVINSIKKIVEGTKDVVNSEVSKTVQTVGFFAGIFGAASLYLNAMFATPLLASELLLIPVRLWGLLMMGFGIRKRTPPWGTVYDSVTKQPIDPAFVTVTDMNGNVVAQSMTDIDGRYGFFLPDGTYNISAEKTNYEFPSKKLYGQVADEMYRDLYFGGEVTVKSGEVIDKNIPLDQKNFDWNESEKSDQDLMVFHKKNEKVFRRISDYIFKVGAVISVISSIINPSTYNIIILAVYVIIQVVLHFGIKGKKLGNIRDRNTGKPFSYAIFRITALDHQTVLRSGVCDAQGRYYCIVPKGKYYIDIEKKNRNGTYTKVFQSDLISSTNGILNKDFAI